MDKSIIATEHKQESDNVINGHTVDVNEVAEPYSVDASVSETSFSEPRTEMNTQQWQRLSPIAILYFAAKLITTLFSNVVYIAPAVLLSYNEILAHPHIWLPVGLLLFSIMVAVTLLKFYFFQYRLSNGHIEIRSGVFSKTHINLPFSRIQNVKLEQPIYYRPFAYTCLQLDTAGSAKQEAKVVALKVDFAEQLKAEILASYQQAPMTEAAAETDKSTQPSVSDSAEILLNRRSLKDLVIHGISSNRVWIFLGLLAPFLDDIAEYGVRAFFYLGIDIEQLLTVADKPWWQVGLFALTLTLLALFTVTLFSIAGAIISFYNFTLHKIDDRYIRRSGLLTKHEVTMRLSRLQMVVKQQDWLDILLKRINLKFEQSNANMQNIQPGAHNNKIIVPAIKYHECQALIADAYPNNQLMSIDYQSISKHFLLRNIGYILLPIFMLLSIFVFVIEKTMLLWLISGIFSVLTALIYCRWRRWGFAQDEHYIYIRKGLLGVDYYCFPRYKVQQTSIKQSWFSKRKALASISLILASGSQTVPFIDESLAYDWVDEALRVVESSGKSWM
ncbi:PH domain-containing protein [Colwellia piezophila]|uniref:PH domain-containing protein n=1 Tax=Colwellia piezophila TaxID=211668 RepID=UPI00036DA979|nr:PH domain-containing protein [Colwellia piezophila]